MKYVLSCIILSSLLSVGAQAKEFKAVHGVLKNQTDLAFTQVQLDVRVDAVKGSPFNGGGELCDRAKFSQTLVADSRGSVNFEIPPLSVNCRPSLFKPAYVVQVDFKIPELKTTVTREFYSDFDTAIARELAVISLYRLVPQDATIHVSPEVDTTNWNYLQYRLSVSFPGEGENPKIGASERNSRLFYSTLPVKFVGKTNRIMVGKSLGEPVMAVTGDFGPNPEVQYFLEVASRGYEGILYQVHANSRLGDGLPADIVDVSIKNTPNNK